MDEKRYPVYIIAHNPNTLAEADAALAAGVNALEPDIQYHPHTKTLCISHDAPGESDELPCIEAYLDHVKSRLDQYPALSLILLDIKLDQPEYDGVSIAEWGRRLHDTVNRLLQGTGLAVIYSISKTEQAGIFADLALSLGPKEAIMIDQESDVEEMMRALQPYVDKGVTSICYADGSYAYLPDLGIASHVRDALHRRCEKGLPRFVSTWVLPTESSIRQYLRMGVDGMIVTNDSIQTAVQLLTSPEFAGRMRLAGRNDDPFKRTEKYYGIEIKTLDRKFAGTDALVNCRLSGPQHSVDINIDTDYGNSFKAGTTSIATVTMPYAGTPVSVSLSHDGTGNAADWLPDLVHVFESSTGLDVYAGFGEWLPKAEVHTRELGSILYTLKIHTNDTPGAGTDADILFILEGEKGTVQRRINAATAGMFEKNGHNVVDIPGADIGSIRTLTVVSDGSGAGPGWHLDSVEIMVNGEPAQSLYFNQWIGPGERVRKTTDAAEITRHAMQQ